MWDYTDKVKDHFTNPRNIGNIPDPDGVGLVGSLACGDALRLMFKLDGKKEKIVDVKFQTFGCASAIASSSALTEMLQGKTLEEAEKITNKDIADYLGGLPDQKMHCSVMGRDALLAAIKNFREARGGTGEKQENLVCVCFGVTRDEIKRVALENGLTTVEQITNYTKAGGGCGGCAHEIEGLLAEVQSTGAECRHDHVDHVHSPVESRRKTAPRITNIQRIKLIEETIEREIRPALRKDGGDIELVDVDGPVVYVSLRGTCSGCKVASFTLNEVVAGKLREFVANDIVVVHDSKTTETNR